MRYERKWIVQTHHYNKLINDINNFKVMFSKAYVDRYVNSIYFDVSNLFSLRENFYGLTEKRKFRIRWYGNKKIINDPVLEIKEKYGWITKKKIIKLENINKLDVSQKQNIIKIENIVNKRLNYYQKLIPLVSTHYLRKYLVSKEKKIRITIDRFIQSGEILNYNFINRGLDLKNLIFEMKYEKKYDDFVKNELNHNHRIAKNSKFINSIFNSSHKRIL